jgi:hypothetical protein
MNKRSIRYRDTWAAPGSQLHAALTEGNKKLAEKIYQDCEKDRAKLEAKGAAVRVSHYADPGCERLNNHRREIHEDRQAACAQAEIPHGALRRAGRPRV